MSIKDKLEIGLKPDAPYREDNLPELQKDDPNCQAGAEPGDGPDQDAARDACDTGAGVTAARTTKDEPTTKKRHRASRR